ncbi:hypothetical protein QQM39_14680 [Streptomyces sp. DT2A-34]|nr:hypothetical protein [Streptomyces sp. DT2A-34]MDO0912043.1 hypothetical protein [Streptomyces sp. DT2A-34]
MLWTLDTEDRKHPDAPGVAQAVISKVKRDDVILMQTSPPITFLVAPQWGARPSELA